jgi:hypothetical protein
MALPGVKTTILDRFYNLGRTDLPGGPLIAVIAKRGTTSATPTPDFSAYYPSSEKDVITEFGENSQIHRAYYELTTGGAPRVVLIALPEDTVFNHVTATLTSVSYSGIDVFDEAFAAAESARADIIVPWGRGSNSTDWDNAASPATPGNDTSDYFYADNSSSVSTSWVNKVGAKCAEITLNSYPVHAVLGVKGIAGSESPTNAAINSGFAFSNLINRDDALSDYGHFVSVVATEIRPLGAPSSWGWSNGATTYASILARLDSWSAPTGKPVYNADRVRYNPTRAQAEALVNKGLVPVTLDFSRAPRWTDGQTFANSASDYIRLTTVRISYDVVKIVRKTAQNYIGEGMSLETRNAFETQISSNLMAMQRVGAITNSDFRVRYAPSENKAFIDVAIVPAFELREVILEISINF